MANHNLSVVENRRCFICISKLCTQGKGFLEQKSRIKILGFDMILSYQDDCQIHMNLILAFHPDKKLFYVCILHLVMRIIANEGWETWMAFLV